MAFSIEDLGHIDLTIGQWCLDKAPPELKKQVADGGAHRADDDDFSAHDGFSFSAL